MQAKHVASGVLPLFDGGKTVLLGKEYRERYNNYYWLEFGGKLEKGETLAETACREANEETSNTLNITLEQVKEAEEFGQFIDYHNPKTDVFYRMYFVYLTMRKPDPEVFRSNSVGSKDVEMVEWKYFDIDDVLNSEDGTLPNMESKIYETSRVRIAMLKNSGKLEKVQQKVDT